MKKYTFALVFAALVPFVSASAYEYGRVPNEYGPASQTNTKSYKKSGTMRKNGGYRNVITNNFYYNQSTPSDYYAPKKSSYNNGGYYNPNVNVQQQTKKTKKTYSSQERKFFLAHPFFQPLKGKFGSVTDFSYAHNSFNFDVLNGAMYDVDMVSPGYNTHEPFSVVALADPISGKADTAQVVVKEDFSFGLSDTISIIGMLQYDKTKISFKDWSDGSEADSKSDSGLNIFGIGLQNRFLDTDDWIGMVSGFFQHQKDTANTFIGDIKVGYKIDRTTVYGIGRLGYSNLIKGDIYGMYVDDAEQNFFMLSYKTDVKDILYLEGGLGIFSVLSKDFTLIGEAIYGNYDWHNQMSIKGGISWQPGSSFALNIYGMTSVYDSAKDKVKTYMTYENNPDTTNFPTLNQGTQAVYTTGDYKIKDYKEWKVGAQIIFYF